MAQHFALTGTGLVEGGMADQGGGGPLAAGEHIFAGPELRRWATGLWWGWKSKPVSPSGSGPSGEYIPQMLNLKPLMASASNKGCYIRRRRWARQASRRQQPRPLRAERHCRKRRWPAVTPWRSSSVTTGAAAVWCSTPGSSRVRCGSPPCCPRTPRPTPASASSWEGSSLGLQALPYALID